MRIAVLGANGRMGQMVCAGVRAAPDLTLAARVDRGGDGIVAIGPGCFADAQVVIDFSLPEGLRTALPHLGQAALVSGTTGLDEKDQGRLDVRSAVAPVLHAANFSPGVTALVDLVARVAAALPDYEIEIIEAHHRHKKDAPSGTALWLGRAAAEARGQALDRVWQHGRTGVTGERPPGEIGFHAIRGGEIVGEHQVWLIGPDERLELRHTAASRGAFASGAIRAARWLQGRSVGRYTMEQVLFDA